MHIPDDVLSVPVMVSTNVLAAAGVGVGLARMDWERVPRVGVLAAVFFVASYIHINIGPASVHLLLNGLLGFLLGWAALPALAAALFLQAVVLTYGGLTSLGANILIMALPAVACRFLFAGPCRRARTSTVAALWGALAGAAGVALTCLFAALVLHLSDAALYDSAIVGLVVAHVPVLLLETVVVAAAASFLWKVRPELLDAPVRTDFETEVSHG